MGTAGQVERRKRRRAECHGDGVCLYCRNGLSARHEHDHAPVPFRYGGDETFCVCVNCHDLKDRTRYDRIPQDVFAEGWGELIAAWEALGTSGRIMAMATLAGTMDAHETARRVKALDEGRGQ